MWPIGWAALAIQTTMLAVSGSVEAARSGDFGRGFSVVSTDIRTLARSAGDNADKVKDIGGPHKAHIAARRGFRADRDRGPRRNRKEPSDRRRLSLITADIETLKQGNRDIQKATDVILHAVAEVVEDYPCGDRRREVRRRSKPSGHRQPAAGAGRRRPRRGDRGDRSTRQRAADGGRLTAATMSSARTVRFQVADMGVALAAADVTEIVRRPRMIRVPQGPNRLIGLANLRGVATPIFSLAGLLGRSDGDEGAWVVVLNRSPALGLLVDRVDSVSDGNKIEPGFLIVDDGGNTRSVALDALLAGQSAALQGRSAAQLPAIPDAVPALREGAAVGLLSFTLAGQNYALRLTDIVEVAPLPARGRKGPGASLGKMTIRDRKIETVSLHAHCSAWAMLKCRHPGRAACHRRRCRRQRGRAGGRRRARHPARPRNVDRRATRCCSAAIATLHGSRSVMRMPDGRGVVSVLTVASLFPRRRGARRGSCHQPPRGQRTSSRKLQPLRHLSSGRRRIRLSGSSRSARSVRPAETMTRVPGAPDYVAECGCVSGALWCRSWTRGSVSGQPMRAPMSTAASWSSISAARALACWWTGSPT